LSLWQARDWQAIASLATLAAVGVALLPIFREWRRRRNASTVFRAQLLLELISLLPTLQGKARPIAGDAIAGDVPFNPIDTAAIGALQSLLGQVDLLPTRQANAVIIAITNLVLFYRVPPDQQSAITAVESVRTARATLSLVHAAIKELEQSRFTFGRHAEVPGGDAT
jgi:hypothetical protein